MDKKMLKRIYAGDYQILCLYDHVRVRPEDGRALTRHLLAAERHASRFMRSERVRIAALLWENFTRRDWWCTFTFRPGKLPQDRRQAGWRWGYFLRLLRQQGYRIRYLRVIECKHGEGRYHFHAVVGDAPRRVLAETWRSAYGDDVHIVHFRPELVWIKPDGKPGLSSYMSKESARGQNGGPVGRHTYSRSRGTASLLTPECIKGEAPPGYYLELPPGMETVELLPLVSTQFCQSQYLICRAPQEDVPTSDRKRGKGI